VYGGKAMYGCGEARDEMGRWQRVKDWLGGRLLFVGGKFIR